MAVVQVVKYSGGPDVFAWKFPNEELGTWTQVIVNESQEAVLFKGGQALDVLGPGRHTLSTANIPVLSKLVNLPFGGRSPFSAEIWYINRVHSLDIKWGTTAPIQLQDPKYNVLLPLRSFGQFGIRVQNSKTFLTKLVGTLPAFDKGHIERFFKGIYMTNVKDSISSYLVNKGVSMLEINAYLVELSEHLKERITPALEEYGITLINFFVKSVNVPEDDPAVIRLRDALAKKAEMDIIGFNYVQERSFDTLEGAATNQGSAQAGMMGAGIGMGMGLGVGGAMGGQMGNISQSININPTKKCPGCNADIDAASRFCNMCGNDTQPPPSPVAENVATKDACIACKADITAGSKFCNECGASQARVCGKCGVQISGNPKFCAECGNDLSMEGKGNE